MVAPPCRSSNNSGMERERSLPTFAVSADGPRITPEMVDQALLDDDARIELSVDSALEWLRDRVQDRPLVEELLHDRRADQAGE
ncbi:MAG: hypothetical protein K9G24_02590 [Candidatus Nanopelagicales bacterium]|nr:hypothetical protein [Candidatus Nanopelagicales bacterium]